MKILRVLGDNNQINKFIILNCVFWLCSSIFGLRFSIFFSINYGNDNPIFSISIAK